MDYDSDTIVSANHSGYGDPVKETELQETKRKLVDISDQNIILVKENNKLKGIIRKLEGKEKVYI